VQKRHQQFVPARALGSVAIYPTPVKSVLVLTVGGQHRLGRTRSGLVTWP